MEQIDFNLNVHNYYTVDQRKGGDLKTTILIKSLSKVHDIYCQLTLKGKALLEVSPQNKYFGMFSRTPQPVALIEENETELIDISVDFVKCGEFLQKHISLPLHTTEGKPLYETYHGKFINIKYWVGFKIRTDELIIPYTIGKAKEEVIVRVQFGDNSELNLPSNNKPITFVIEAENLLSLQDDTSQKIYIDKQPEALKNVCINFEVIEDPITEKEPMEIQVLINNSTPVEPIREHTPKKQPRGYHLLTNNPIIVGAKKIPVIKNHIVEYLEYFGVLGKCNASNLSIDKTMEESITENDCVGVHFTKKFTTIEEYVDESEEDTVPTENSPTQLSVKKRIDLFNNLCKQQVIERLKTNIKKQDDTIKIIHSEEIPINPNCLVAGMLDSEVFCITKPLTGKIAVVHNAVESVELELIVFETCGPGYLPDETVIKAETIFNENISVGETVIFCMTFPPLVTCPTVISDSFKIEFAVRIVVKLKNLLQKKCHVEKTIPIIIKRFA